MKKTYNFTVIRAAITLGIMLALLLFALTSCSSDNDITTEQIESVIRHDTAPDNIRGKWSSVSNPETVTIEVVESIVYFNLNNYNKGTFEVNTDDFKAIKSSNRLYTIYYAGMTIILSTGTGQYAEDVTLTINNECITRMKRYVPKPVEPEPQQPEEQTPIFN